MDSARFDQVLETGSFAEVDDFADSETCAVIDWRAEPEEVVEALQAFLPDDFLRQAEADESSLTVVMASRRTKVAAGTPGDSTGGRVGKAAAA